MKKAIVTGANGFVGSAVCRELSNNEVKVCGIVRNENSDVSNIEDLKNVEICTCDLRDINNLASLINETDFDVFYHFAWEGTSGAIRTDKDKQVDNISNACDAVRVSKTLGCKRFVYASSVMEYEIIHSMKENINPVPSEVYSVAKLCADYMCKIVATSEGVDYLSGIITNIYGPGEISQRLINSSLRKMLNKEHCAFSSGNQMYDFIYIEDAAKAFYLIGEKGNAGKSYYIGSLSPQPLKQFLISMKNQVDPMISIGLGELPSRLENFSYDGFDIEAIRHDTGFEPSVSFEEGIRRTVAWLKEIDSNGI